MSSRAILVLGAGLALLTACTPHPAYTAKIAATPLAAGASWQTIATDLYKGKRDDIHFATSKVGFYGTGAGDLFRTVDGGESWTKIWSKPGTFIRAIGFIDDQNGFLGNVGDYYPGVTDKVPLYRTFDGGVTWTPVDLGGAVIEGICAIDVLNTTTVYQGELRPRTLIHAAGRVGGPAKLLRSTNGGKTWTNVDLSGRIGMILDVKFLDVNNGLVFAGSESDIRVSEAVILKTSDGGRSWREVYRSGRKLENSWKGTFVNLKVGFASIQTYDSSREQQVVVKTVDGGETWAEMPLVHNAKARQFGIGFATPEIGWVGTATGGFETRDGGRTWHQVPLAPAANKIRTLAADGTPMIYAIGTEVQRYTDDPQADGIVTPLGF